MRTTTIKGRSENLGRASCELCDVAMFGDAYKYADAEFEEQQVIFQHLHNALVILYNAEYTDTSCI